jgi:Stress responsive A/B Barrel Domain
MIRHEVILRIRPEFSREEIDRTLGEVRDLLMKISGVERVRYGINNAPANRHAMLVVEVVNEVALHRFMRNQQHAHAVQQVGRMAESSAIGSYEVESEHHSS